MCFGVSEEERIYNTGKFVFIQAQEEEEGERKRKTDFTF